MLTHRIRNLIPLVYAVLIIAAFAMDTTVGVVVCIVGGALSGLLWSTLSGGQSPVAGAGRREHRAADRAARRAGRR